MRLVASCLFVLLALQQQQHVALGFMNSKSVETRSFVATPGRILSGNALAASTEEKEKTTTLDGRKIAGEIQPLNNFILVKIADTKDQTEGGILLTGKAKIKKTEGTVISIGPGKTHQESGITFEMPVQPGEGVVYGRYDGTECDINGSKHTLIRDDDILVKFTGGALTLDSVTVVHDKVLVKCESTESESEGGILIAKTSKSERKPSTGEVVKVGPGKMASNGELMKMEVAAGDMVKYQDFAGNEVEIDGEDYSVVRMVDILAKF